MPRPRSTEPRTRLNLEVLVSVRDRLERLGKMMEAESLTEVIRRISAAYEVLLLLPKGELIHRMDDGTERTILIVP